MSTQEEPTQEQSAVIFVPNFWDNGNDGGRVMTPEELEKYRPVNGHPVEEMKELAVEIEGAGHLLDLCEEHFEGQAYSKPAMVAEYIGRADDEKLLEDMRRSLRRAFRMARGSAPESIDAGDRIHLKRLWEDLRADLDEAEKHLDLARTYHVQMDGDDD